MRECAEKRKERCKQTDTENTMATQKTSIKISFINCREEFSAKEFCISNDLHVRNNKSELGNTVFCDICISEREDKHTYAGKSGKRHERLAKLESIISKLGNIAQQSVERERKLEEEFSEIKQTMLVFESHIRNSLTHGTLSNDPTMSPDMQGNIQSSNNTTQKKCINNGTSTYIATLCEMGKALCSESIY